jgi:hypothetical protein
MQIEPRANARLAGDPPVPGRAEVVALTPPGPNGSAGPRGTRLTRDVSRVRARARLNAELRSIAVDLLGPNESDEFPATCANWVAATAEAAVSTVCDSALATLVETLDSLLDTAPAEVVRELDRARQRQAAGFD